MAEGAPFTATYRHFDRVRRAKPTAEGRQGRMGTFRFLPTPIHETSMQYRSFSRPRSIQENWMTDKSDDGAAVDIATDLANLRADIASPSEAIAGLLSGRTDAASAAVKGALGDARDQLSQAASRAQDGALGAAADFERRIERDPLTAVLIAAGIGMAIGMM